MVSGRCKFDALAINPSSRTPNRKVVVIRTQNKPFANDEAAKGWLKEFPRWLEGLNIEGEDRVFILPIKGLLGVKFKIFNEFGRQLGWLHH
jgi:hypothetical protein